MNKIPICSQFLMIPLLCLLCFAFGGCKGESANRSSLHLSMENRSTIDRTLLPNDTPLEVSRYVVEGEGPQDTTFSVISTTNSVEVEGLLIGSWNIKAVGQNSQGVDLVDGSCTVSVTKEPTETVIELDTLSGDGTMKIQLDWDPLKISSPSLEMWLTDLNGTTVAITPTTNNMVNGSVIYSGLYPAGSYLLRAKLYSGSIAVAGCAEVVRVIGNKTTEGAITLTLDKYADLPSSITLTNNLGLPVDCTIKGINTTMVAQESATASLETPDISNLEVVWYLDGEEISNSTTCTFTPSSGQHRLDVIAKGALLASSGSASITFEATVVGTAGVPKLVGSVADNTNGLYIGKDAHIAFLPDGKLLLASNQHQTLQVCRIVRDSLEVVQTYTNADGFNTAQVTDIFVDPTTYRVAIADKSAPGVSIYQYDLSSASLIKMFNRDSLYYPTDGSSSDKKYFTALHHFGFDSASGILHALTGDTPEVVQTNLYATNSAEVAPNDYTWWFFPQPLFDALAVSPGGTSAALLDTEEGVLKLCIKDNFGVLFSNDQDFSTATGTPYLANIASVTFLADDQLIYATDNDIGRFSYQSGTWNQKEIYSSQQNGIGTMEALKQISTNPTHTLLYALSATSMNISSFSVDTTTRALTYLESTSLGQYQPARMAVSPKQDCIAVVSDSNSSLLLCRIP